MSPALVTRLAALLLALFVSTAANAGGPATGRGNGPAALLLDSSLISPSVIGLAPGGGPADSHVATTYRVRAIAGLTGHQHSFFICQTLQVRDSSGTVVRTIASETPCPTEVGPTPDSYQQVLANTVWDGLDSTGQPREGLFTFSVETRFERRDEKLAGRNASQFSVVPIAELTSALPGTVTCDFTAPQIVITRPADDCFVNEPRQTIEGTVDDPLAILVVQGQAVVLAPDGTFSLLLTVIPGQNTIAATATDRAGNIGTASVTLSLDLQPPTITALQPPSGSWTNALEVSLTGRVEDDFGVASALVDGTPVALGPDGTFTTLLLLPTESPVQTTIEARDLAGNATSLVHELFVDRTAPVITFSNIADGSFVNEPEQTIEGRVIEANLASLVSDGRISSLHPTEPSRSPSR